MCVCVCVCVCMCVCVFLLTMACVPSEAGIHFTCPEYIII